jgi:hypothetical protein
MVNRVVSPHLARLVNEAIKIYNKYRSPESTAKLIEIKDNIVTIRFEGSYCETCGLNDWVVDFKYVLEDLGASSEILEIKGGEGDLWNTEGWRIGVFKITEIPPASRGGKASRREP